MGAHIFNKEIFQQELDRKGYTIVPFADENMLSELKTFYKSLDNLPLKGTNVTMFNPSYEYRKSVDDKIRQVCGAKAEEMMDGYRVLYTNFMIKEPGVEGDFPVHQDWTYVDESKYTSYAFWIPMQDVDETNGALHVVEGSHKFLTALRGPYVHEPFSHISQQIKDKYSVAIRLRAGEALVWDHRLIHFSRPNTTDVPRLAFTLIMVPKEEQIIHCYGIPDSQDDGEIVVYKVDTDFYLRYVISRRPENVPIIKHAIQPITNFSISEFDGFFSNSN